MPSSRSCPHDGLVVEGSSHAEVAGFKRPSYERRLAATTVSGRCPPAVAGWNDGELSSADVDQKAERDVAFTFPAPLVLTGDDLALNPRYPPQSLRSFVRAEMRNKISRRRQTLYLAAQPLVAEDVSWMRELAEPVSTSHVSTGQKRKRAQSAKLEPPNASDVLEYLRAFYHGMEVKELKTPFQFVQWDKKSSGAAPKHVGLRFGDACTRIRMRPCPDGTYGYQLNLNDILDALIEHLPNDAYAYLLLIQHDLYDAEDDDFCCGMAFSGGRVALVSSARYHPALDGATVDRCHMWPTSHCRKYVGSILGSDAPESNAPPTDTSPTLLTPIQAAASAAEASGPPKSPSELHGLWFSRVVRTAAHELGHCLGIGHCVYYACVMQGTTCLAEDCRQPPYLCPICLKKMVRSMTEYTPKLEERGFISDRYKSLLRVCERWQNVGMFAAFGAWLNLRLQQTPL